MSRTTAAPRPSRAADLVGGERPVRAGEPGDQVGERVVDGVGEGLRRAGRHGDPESVAEPADVLDGGPPSLAGDPDLDDAPGRGQPGQRLGGVDALGAALLDLLGGKGAEQPEQVGHPLGAAGPPLRCQALELGLDLGQHRGVEQLAELGPAEQLGQQPLVERERRGPALGDG